MKKESNALYILRLTVTLLLICAAVASREGVWSCTNLELVRYLKAMEQFDGVNRSDQTLWFEVDGRFISLLPGCSL